MLRGLLFLLAPIVLAVALEFLIPLSGLLTAFAVAPFQVHGGYPKSYVVDVLFLATLAILSAVIGRRHSLLASVGIYCLILASGATITHLVLSLLGFPVQVDAP